METVHQHVVRVCRGRQLKKRSINLKFGGIVYTFEPSPLGGHALNHMKKRCEVWNILRMREYGERTRQLFRSVPNRLIYSLSDLIPKEHKHRLHDFVFVGFTRDGQYLGTRKSLIQFPRISFSLMFTMTVSYSVSPSFISRNLQYSLQLWRFMPVPNAVRNLDSLAV